jgi:hypothetical protein
MTTFPIILCKDCDTKYYLKKCSDCKNFFCNACYWKCNVCNENPNEIVDEVDLEGGQLEYRDVYEDENTDIEEYEVRHQYQNVYSQSLFSEIMNSFNNIAREMINSDEGAIVDPEIDLV